ncbi:MAG TPA: hypothetical protein VN306_10520 [Mycobacterium sp.]|nr:hypothetical protein [Mycobacterium sp.]
MSPASTRAFCCAGSPDDGGRALLWARAVPWESDVPGSVLRQLLQEDVATEPSAAAAQFVERVRRRTGTAAALLTQIGC